ncbi:MAG: hypothetical protein FWC35_02045 [Proteobacteria bacterium]|nr:hypothetical protein [Pseudomonadota bacterium]
MATKARQESRIFFIAHQRQKQYRHRDPSLANHFFDLAAAVGEALPVFVLASIEVCPHIATSSFCVAFPSLLFAVRSVQTGVMREFRSPFAGSLLGLNALTFVAAALFSNGRTLDNALPAFRGRRRFVFVMNRLASRYHSEKKEWQE